MKKRTVGTFVIDYTLEDRLLDYVNLLDRDVDLFVRCISRSNTYEDRQEIMSRICEHFEIISEISDSIALRDNEL